MPSIRATASAALYLSVLVSLSAQTTLRIDESVAVYLPPSASPRTIAGAAGYRVTVPADAAYLRVTFEDFNVDFSTYSMIVRPAIDIDTADLTIGSVAATGADHKRVAVVPTAYLPNERTYFIGFVLPPRTRPLMGILTATLERLPAGENVTVPFTAQVMLAGQPPGAIYSNTHTAPLNSPARVNTAIFPGRSYGIVAGGGTTYTSATTFQFQPPSGAYTNHTLASAFGIAGLTAPRSALVGVFLGPGGEPPSLTFAAGPPDTLVTSLNLTRGNTDTTIVKPRLRQPFYIGSGLTSSRTTKAFVAPAGATELYLGLNELVPQLTLTGAITARISPLPLPATPLGNPVTVGSNAQAMLAGSPDFTVYRNQVAPLDAPAEAGIAVVAGQRLTMAPTGLLAYPTSLVFTIGMAQKQTLPAAGGLSGITGPRGGLIAVFTGPTINTQLSPPLLDFNIVSADELVQPQLQQLFYIGTGIASTQRLKNFVVPPGATRLFFGVLEAEESNVRGQFLVHVATGGPTAPTIAAIVNAAGFAQSALAFGSIVSIFGTGYGPLAQAGATPLPTSLSDTEVYFDGVRAPLFFVSPNQINAQIPWELGPRFSAHVMVKRGGAFSHGFFLAFDGFQPGIFVDGAANPIIVNNTTGRLVSESEPVRAGDVLIIYASGLGPTIPPPRSGEPASGSPLMHGVAPVRVVFKQADRQNSLNAAFAGLAPGFIGVFQVNVQVPQGLAPGRAALTLTSDGVGLGTSPEYPVFVRE
jgi:uncharacterized protein (TIGR03437 family)